MSIVLYHNPNTRASNVVWMLEEVGVRYELRAVDLTNAEQRKNELLPLNPMGKLPVLVDGSAVVTESAAIALYLGDRYSLGKLAPAVDDPRRAPYLRWTLFSPSVIEPGCMAKAANWEFRPGSAGWGTYETMVKTIDHALSTGDYVTGSEFTMADTVFGGTLRYMSMFKMLEPSPRVRQYLDRLAERPAKKRADDINVRARDDRGLGQPRV